MTRSIKDKNGDWLTRNQDNVSEWGDMSIPGLLFQWASTITIQLGRVQSCPHSHFIEN
jgi:hypothetical protein